MTVTDSPLLLCRSGREGESTLIAMQGESFDEVSLSSKTTEAETSVSEPADMPADAASQEKPNVPD